MRGEEEELARFAALVERRLGLVSQPEGHRELATLLEQKAPRWGREAYLQRLEAAGPGDPEVRALAEQLTVGETYFFRHQAQLDALVEEVLPEVQREGRCARVLSAGSSTGEEAYSVAILARESARVDAGRLFITGVDINPRVIARARQARYAAWAMRATSEPLRERWFHALPEGALELRPEVREAVHFEERNLLEESASFWAPNSFDVILCRNVLIYFSPETTRSVIARLAQVLTPGGYLFLGPSETLRGISDAFEVVQAGEAFYYRLRSSPVPLSRPRPVASRASTPAALPPRPVPVPAPAPKGAEVASEATGNARAWRLFEAERYAEAGAWLESLPVQERQQPSARLMQAMLQLHTGRLSEAERLGEALAESGAMGAAVQYLLGLCREQAGDGAGARLRYERAVHLEPTFALGHLRLGMLARREGALATARVALRLALTLLAHEPPLHLSLFGGGFGRHGLMQVCQRELWACSEVA